MCMLSCFSRVWLFETPWAIAHQAPLSMGLSRQEYWSGLSCPAPGGLPDPRTERLSPVSPASQADSFLLSHRGNLKEGRATSKTEGTARGTRSVGLQPLSCIQGQATTYSPEVSPPLLFTLSFLQCRAHISDLTL
ncbi:unnamed protein product [Rangifer tarandus platyrhynchus]|uniref:Uncharacterized protein n=1 Tax=Rangifer tarandus platyrhynchus TaxID=3082113 RepID=A0ABN8Z4S3_RANTA|nr:unnamed protein product [Rangifer tarandus platyrhynchus]